MEAKDPILFADRFELKMHWGAREASVYELMIEKGGPKLQSADHFQSWKTHSRKLDKESVAWEHSHDFIHILDNAGR
jgi:uncharacterized protein (TIGR03435 family)